MKKKKQKNFSPAGASLPDRYSYVVAGVIGLCAAAFMLPAATIDGSGGLWRDVGGDPAMVLSGHFAYQAPGWHWPLLRTTALFWPVGVSILMTDSNPAMSIVAKLLAIVRGHSANLLGVWLLLCWVLQPIAAVYALRGCRFAGVARTAASLEAVLAVSCLSLLCPAWLLLHHVNLLGHFLLLSAFGLSVRMCVSTGGWGSAACLLTLAIFIHPYLFVFSAIMFAAPVLARVTRPKTRGWRQPALYALACSAPVVLSRLLGGAIKPGGSGFTFYSMNLMSPFWPQRSGLFGSGLKVIDATGGQAAGFNYLGAGVLFMLVVCAGLWRRGEPGGARGRRAIAIPLVMLTLLALTPRVYAGDWLVLPVPAEPWSHLFAFIRASGRAFWLVGYALMVVSVACIDARLPRARRLAVFVPVIALQFIDTSPLRAEAYRFFAGEYNKPAPFVVPRDVRLFRVVPACDPRNDPADQLRLQAAREGVRVAEVRVARLLPGFDCETALSDGLETPFISGELRFFLPSVASDVRPGILGNGIRCAMIGAGEICSLDLPDAPAGGPAPPGRALAVLSAAAGTVAFADMKPFLSSGWHVDSRGIAWSEGPYATLLFGLPGGHPPAALILNMDGLAARQGGGRSVSMSVNGGAAANVDLPDERATTITLPMRVAESGVVRVAIELKRPLDPARRAIMAPARRVGVRLYSLRLSEKP